MSTSAELASSSKESEPQAQTASPAIAPPEGLAAPIADVGFAIPPVDPSALGTIYRRPLKHSVNASVRAATFRRSQQIHGNRTVQRSLERSVAPAPTRLVQRKCACGGTCEDCQRTGVAPGAEAQVAEPAIARENAGGVIQRQAERVVARQPLDFGPPPPDRPLRPHVPDPPRAAGQGATVNIPPASPGSTCFTGDVCSRPIPGSATRFAAHVDEQLEKGQKNPARPVASAVIAFANSESPGLISGVTLVVNPNLGSTAAGGQAYPDNKKVEVTSAFEAEAAQFNAVPPLDRVGGKMRFEWRLNALRILTHEMAHIRFSASPPSGLPALNATAMAELDELNAILSELPFTFERSLFTELDEEAQTEEIQRVARFYVERRGEGIRGILTSLRCSASCADVDTAVRRVFEAQAASWRPEYRDAVLTVLANPSVRLQWPMPPPVRLGLPPAPRSAGMGGIQRQASSQAAESITSHGVVADLMAASQSQPLDRSSQSAMEAGFGRDLSGVRVHTDTAAADAAAMLDAAAFTTGRDIYFSESRFAPSTGEGRHLLAHEIAHTIQQSAEVPAAAVAAPLVVAPADDPLEADADRAADDVAGSDGSDPERRTHAPHAFERTTTAAACQSTTATGIVQRTPEEEGGVLPARPGAAGPENAPPPEPAERRVPRGEWFHAGSYRTGYYTIANDREFMRTEMMRLIADKGLMPAFYWVMSHAARQGRSLEDAPRPFSAHTFGDRPRVRSPIDVERETRQDEVRQRVAPDAIPLMTEVFAEVYREAVEYLDGFEERARAVTLAILQSSEDRANAERIRYGLVRTEVSPPDWSADDFGQPEQPYSIYSHSMSARGPSEGLVGAAKDLKAKRDAIDALQARRFRLYRLDVGWFSTELYLPDENKTEAESLQREIDQARTEYDVLRNAYEQRYPILARFGENPQALGQIAQGANAQAAAVLNREIYGTLDNIAQVRGELTPGGRVKIWKLPEIVQLTKVATQATGTSARARMRSKVVDDKRQQVLDEAFWRNLAIGALALGLALLAAIPTGGSSLVAGVAAIAALGSLGLSIYVASESLQDYNLEKAMTGTDFDRARAISNEDPSLFWLAVDIVGVVLDVGPALKAARTTATATRAALTSARTTFRTLAPLARRALTAEGPELAETLVAIRRAAASEQLGETVVRSIERVRAGTGVEQAIGRAAGHEAAARAALAGDSLGKSATTVIGGHTVRVMPGSGALVLCSSCIWMRGMFANELENATLLRRLETLEENARAAAAADDAAAATRVAEETRKLADELMALRRTRLQTATRVLSATEIEEFGRLRGLDPSRMTQEEIESLQRLREASGEAFQGRLAANTPDHKAERWLEYRGRGGEWSYERWSANYQQNMKRATRSHELVEKHRATLGWGETQIVTQPFGPDGARRILDIAEETVDPLTGQRRVLRGVEHKEGYITMSDAIRAEVEADRALVQQGTAIEWYIDGRASQGLRDALAGPPPIPLRETRPTTPIAEIRGASAAAE